MTDAQNIATHYGGFFGSLLYSKWLDLEPATHDLDIDIKDLQKVFGRIGSTARIRSRRSFRRLPDDPRQLVLRNWYRRPSGKRTT